MKAKQTENNQGQKAHSTLVACAVKPALVPNTMKLHNVIQQNTAATVKPASTVVKAKGSKKSPTAVKVSATKGKPVKVAPPVLTTMIAILSGVRGLAARLVEVATYGKGSDMVIKIRALQANTGLKLANGQFATISKAGLLDGKKERQAQLELGGYVNGRLTGAKVKLVSKAQFAAIAKPALVRWNIDKDAVKGVYIGNPTVKGMLAIESNGYYWQVEQDSNANNRDERGKLQPVKTGGKLAIVTL